jgi:GTPase SAR1 family protein
MIKAWDLGGHDGVRHVWQDYFVESDALIYMVDLADPDRLAEAAEVRSTAQG